jgi:hypothetical protein
MYPEPRRKFSQFFSSKEKSEARLEITRYHLPLIVIEAPGALANMVMPPLNIRQLPPGAIKIALGQVVPCVVEVGVIGTAFMKYPGVACLSRIVMLIADAPGAAEMSI